MNKLLDRTDFPLLATVLALALGGVGVYVGSGGNYPVFHAIAETFTAVVACCVFVVAWNARARQINPYIRFLGIAYLFVGALDLLHMLAHGGAGIFEEAGPNLATQLWIAARYLQAVALLLAPLFLTRPFPAGAALAGFGGVFCVLSASVFWWKTCPPCYLVLADGGGLTAFKAASEYVICGLLLGALGLLFARRAALDRRTFGLMAAAIALTFASELAFALGGETSAAVNVAGHILKVVAFYLVYRTVVETALFQPFDAVARELRDRDEQLAAERERAQRYLDATGAIVVLIGPDHQVKLINRAGCEFLDCEEGEVVGKDWFEEFLPERCRVELRDVFDKAVAGQAELPEQHENPVLTRSGDERMIAWTNTTLTDADWSIVGILSSGQDISERRWAEEQLRDREKRLRAVFEASLDAIIIFDNDGFFVDFNPAACELLGVTRERLAGMHLRDVLEPTADFPRLLQSFRQNQRTEFRLLRPDGRHVEVGCSATVDFLPERHLAVLRDISARKR